MTSALWDYRRGPQRGVWDDLWTVGAEALPILGNRATLCPVLSTEDHGALSLLSRKDGFKESDGLATERGR